MACDPKLLMLAAKCWACLDQKQIAQAELALLCSILQSLNPVATCDIQSLMESGKCFACLDQKQIGMASLQLLCEILQAGGGGGGASCNLCGPGDPVDVPTCDCALYTNTSNGEFWFWQPVEMVWKKLLSNT